MHVVWAVYTESTCSYIYLYMYFFFFSSVFFFFCVSLLLQLLTLNVDIINAIFNQTHIIVRTWMFQESWNKYGDYFT